MRRISWSDRTVLRLTRLRLEEPIMSGTTITTTRQEHISASASITTSPHRSFAVLRKALHGLILSYAHSMEAPALQHIPGLQGVTSIPSVTSITHRDALLHRVRIAHSMTPCACSCGLAVLR